MLIIVTAIAYIRRKTNSFIRELSISFGWICWVIINFLLIYTRYSYLDSLSSYQGLFGSSLSGLINILSFPTLLLIGLPLSVLSIWDMFMNFSRFILPVALVALGNGLLFIFPYILWSMGRIPRYMTAVAFVALLMACGLTAGYKYLKPQLPIVEPEKGKRIEKAKADNLKASSM